MITERVRRTDAVPLSAVPLVETILAVTEALPAAQRVSVGFPGLIREGIVRNVPALSRRVYGGEVDPTLQSKWLGFDLGRALAEAFDRPTDRGERRRHAGLRGGAWRGLRVRHDAGHRHRYRAVQPRPAPAAPRAGARAAPQGRDGRAADRQRCPQGGGQQDLVQAGPTAIEAYHEYLFFDHLYIGGGNAKHLTAADLPPNAEIVPNTAGITGGVRVWDLLRIGTLNATAPEFEALMRRIRACTLCAEHLPLGPRPVIQADPRARLLVVGQAPGRRAHDTGLPFNDASGDRLRDWSGVDRSTFYDRRLVALVPMGFCYPGTTSAGDAPPRTECAPAWRGALLPWLAGVRLTVLAGSYAHAYYLGARGTVAETVAAWRATRT